MKAKAAMKAMKAKAAMKAMTAKAAMKAMKANAPAEPAKGRPKRSGTVLVAPQKKGGEWKTATKIAVPPFLSIREPPF